MLILKVYNSLEVFMYMCIIYLYESRVIEPYTIQQWEHNKLSKLDISENIEILLQNSGLIFKIEGHENNTEYQLWK